MISTEDNKVTVISTECKSVCVIPIEESINIALISYLCDIFYKSTEDSKYVISSEDNTYMVSAEVSSY